MRWFVGVATRRDRGEAQEKTKFIILISQRQETWPIRQGHLGKTPEWSGGRRQEQGEHFGHGLYWGFCRKDEAEQGTQFRFGEFE